jgi:glutamate-1-semialdehyde 2,1-aminomutase
MACGIRSTSVSPEYQMIVSHAQGSKIYDCSGNAYIDYLLGSGPMFIGHAHPAVVAAVREQLAAGSSYLLANEPAIRLCEAIVELVPCAEKVTLHNSGSEATSYAMRLARAWRKRDKILKFEGGFHGMNDDALMSNQWTFQPADYPRAVPNSAGIPRDVQDDVLIAPFNDLERTSALLQRHSEELGGIIVEPLCRTIPPQPGFLEGLRDLARNHDIPLIFDEVVTGFRMGLGGAQAYYGVTPDLCAIGKAISGGHPLGVVCGRSDIMDLAGPASMMSGDHVRLTGTYSSNPISAVAALAVIGELRKPGVYEAVERKGNRLRQALTELLAKAGIAAQVIGEATAFQPWFTDEAVIDHRSGLRADMGLNFTLIDRLLDHGIVKGHEKFFVSTAHTDQDIDDTIAALASVVETLRR